MVNGVEEARLDGYGTGEEIVAAARNYIENKNVSRET